MNINQLVIKVAGKEKDFTGRCESWDGLHNLVIRVLAQLKQKKSIERQHFSTFNHFRNGLEGNWGWSGEEEWEVGNQSEEVEYYTPIIGEYYFFSEWRTHRPAVDLDTAGEPGKQTFPSYCVKKLPVIYYMVFDSTLFKLLCIYSVNYSNLLFLRVR